MLSRDILGLIILYFQVRHIFLPYELKSLFLLFFEVNGTSLFSRTSKLEPKFASGTMYSRVLKWHVTHHHNYSNFNQPHLLFASLRFQENFSTALLC